MGQFGPKWHHCSVLSTRTRSACWSRDSRAEDGTMTRAFPARTGADGKPRGHSAHVCPAPGAWMKAPARPVPAQHAAPPPGGPVRLAPPPGPRPGVSGRSCAHRGTHAGSPAPSRAPWWWQGLRARPRCVPAPGRAAGPPWAGPSPASRCALSAPAGRPPTRSLRVGVGGRTTGSVSMDTPPPTRPAALPLVAGGGCHCREGPAG